MELGQRLRQARLEAGLSQRQLCGDTITRNMLSQIENGSARPSMDTLRYLASRLGKPVSYFLEENAVLSGNQDIMARSRQAYAEEKYDLALELLKGYTSPDPVFDGEAALIRLLCLLALAEVAAKENRLPYATRLLEQAEQAGSATPYFTPELRRRLLLLRAQTSPDFPAQLLDPDDRELLLRGKWALEEKDYTRAAVLLDAAADHSGGRWAWLRGEADFGLGLYAQAAAFYRQAEKAFPEMVYPRLEYCYLQLEDYKMAYWYASKQKNA